MRIVDSSRLRQMPPQHFSFGFSALEFGAMIEGKICRRRYEKTIKATFGDDFELNLVLNSATKNLNMFKYVIFCTLTLALFSCRKNEEPMVTVPDDTIPIVDTIKTALGLVEYYSNDTYVSDTSSCIMYYHNYVKNFYMYFTVRQNLPPNINASTTFHNLPFKEGKYPLKRDNNVSAHNGLPSFFSGITVDGDQYAGQYYLDTTRTAFLEIVELDTVAQTVKGRFELTMFKDERLLNYNSLVDTVKVRDGRFYLRYQ
jgi:hypothetical protein